MDGVTRDRVGPDQRVLCLYVAKSVHVTQRLENATRIVFDQKGGKIEFVGDMVGLIGKVQPKHMVVQIFYYHQTRFNVVKPVCFIFCQRLPFRPLHFLLSYNLDSFPSLRLFPLFHQFLFVCSNPHLNE